MSERLDVTKTYKLFIDGKFPRSESGRTIAIVLAQGAGKGKGQTKSNEKTKSDGVVIAHVCRASRKDVRDAATAARKALGPWREATAYLRGQILYRMGEMLQGKRQEVAEALCVGKPASSGARAAALREVDASIDRLVAFSGWADKYAQVLGCNNAVAGPFYNFTVPEPTGVIGIIGPEGDDSLGFLGLISLIAPVIVSGNTCIALGGSKSSGVAIATAILGEVIATSDVPAGVVNLLTGDAAELAPVLASHRDIDGIHALGISADVAKVLREGAGENLKRVTVRQMLSDGAESGAGRSKGKPAGSNAEQVDLWDSQACESPWWIERFVEMKTIWHPSGV